LSFDPGHFPSPSLAADKPELNAVGQQDPVAGKEGNGRPTFRPV
jgi:hypothetical protein